MGEKRCWEVVEMREVLDFSREMVCACGFIIRHLSVSVSKAGSEYKGRIKLRVKGI